MILTLNVRDFGAVGDFRSDDTQAFKNAILAIKIATVSGSPTAPTGGGIIFVPPGTYLITDTLKFTNLLGITFVGAGAVATKLMWFSTNTASPIVKLINCYCAVIRDMSIMSTSDATHYKATACIECNIDVGVIPAGQPPPRNNVFERLALGAAPSVTGADKGIQFTAVYYGSGPYLNTWNSNNDFHTIRDVTISNTVTAGISFEHSQCKGNTITRCNIDTSLTGIDASQGVGGAQGGSFTVFGGSINNCTGPSETGQAILLGNFTNDAIGIYGVSSDGCQRFFLQGTAPYTAAWPILISGCRLTLSAMASDRNFISFENCGPVTIVGNSFYPGTKASALNPRVYMVVNGATCSGVINMIGNWFGTNGTKYTDYIWNGFLGLNQSGSFLGNTSSGNKIDSKPIEQDLVANDSSGASPYSIDSLVQFAGLSATQTKSNNLRGSFTISGASTFGGPPTFPIAESDSLYFLTVTPTTSTNSPAAGSNRVLNIVKTAVGFTVFIETAPGVGLPVKSVSFDWHLFR